MGKKNRQVKLSKHQFLLFWGENREIWIGLCTKSTFDLGRLLWVDPKVIFLGRTELSLGAKKVTSRGALKIGFWSHITIGFDHTITFLILVPVFSIWTGTELYFQINSRT